MRPQIFAIRLFVWVCFCGACGKISHQEDQYPRITDQGDENNKKILIIYKLALE